MAGLSHVDGPKAAPVATAETLIETEEKSTVLKGCGTGPQEMYC